MYLRNFEIDHLRANHPALLDQANGYGMKAVADGRGYELNGDMPDALFSSIIDAIADAPDTRRKGDGMKTKHSPTPWAGGKHAAGIYDATGKQIAKIFDRGSAGFPFWDGEAEANIQLMTAAPELLHAAKLALDALTTTYENGKGIVDAEKALHAFGNLKAAITAAEVKPCN